jgi:hypothetical protein
MLISIIERIRPRLNEPWLRQIVVMLEIQTIALRQAYEKLNRLEKSNS